jgi:RNA 2',3'-cyclic 3'-phosphodiesterase
MAEKAMAGRLFFGVPLTEEVRQGLVGHLARALGSTHLPGRLVPPPNWHITMRFLGDTSQADYEQVRGRLTEADLGKPFTVRFDRLGAFPRPHRARVLWLGMSEGVEPLTALATVLEQTVVAAGFEPEGRPFAAHLTLSRLKPEQDLLSFLATVPPFPVAMPVSALNLYRSHLSPTGARYEVLHQFALGPASPRPSV